MFSYKVKLHKDEFMKYLQIFWMKHSSKAKAQNINGFISNIFFQLWIIKVVFLVKCLEAYIFDEMKKLLTVEFFIGKELCH